MKGIDVGIKQGLKSIYLGTSRNKASGKPYFFQL